MAPEFDHATVLLDESVEALAVREGGVYVDCTAGGGGHSVRLLRVWAGRAGWSPWTEIPPP